ncbi:Electron transfer flavoprotein large subunit [Actinomyces bovis]|uniref:Electron transfer flavoprotein large subunit n=1 Tax=Actinomyces bovis TaxID=1658 RepID=A0ABY1VNX9_9ACTO|nr:electron transfer flavoprotein subunit alpha/FixB family protein [Actinomyces bovis]SPT52768.1 Electron transfer flavoprotein large subunit [Actinomyces bovis]VEG54781.1 Electron transfer flavoprotein large subunit [Actinomyces israelii]
MLDTPILVLVDLAEGSEPTAASAELLTTARSLTSGGVTALALAPVTDPTALAAFGATRLLVAELGEPACLAGLAADAVVAAVRETGPAAVLVTSDYRGKEIAGRAAVLLGSACVSDVADIKAVDDSLHASKLVLSGSWDTTLTVSATNSVPVLAVRPGSVEPTACLDAASLSAEPLAFEPTAEAAAVRLISREISQAAGPELASARTVVVMGRGTDGDLELVRSIAEPLGAAIGATRVACDEGWIDRSAQVGQTGASISPRLYLSLGVSGAVHHTSGIQGAGTIVAIDADSEAPIFELADFGVVGDVAEVVPQLVAELERLRS